MRPTFLDGAQTSRFAKNLHRIRSLRVFTGRTKSLEYNFR